MKPLIKSRAPLRISFIGGGTDVSPFPEKYGGEVINVTITKYVTSTLRFRDDRKLSIKIVGEGEFVYPNIKDIEYNGKLDLVKAVIKHLYQGERGLDIYIYKDVLSSSGLGSSSCLFVSCIGLFNEILEKKLDRYKIAELAYKLEREELKNAGGRQDQYATVFGGINFIEFRGDDFVSITPLDIPKEIVSELEENLVLLNIGARKRSGNIIEEQIKNVETKKDTLSAMLKTKEMVSDMKGVLLSGDLARFGILLNKAWQLKKQFSAKISKPDIDDIYAELRNVGALGGKISGAGGGGHMFVFCKSFTKDKVEEAAKNWGAKVVPFKFENSGLVTWKTNF